MKGPLYVAGLLRESVLVPVNLLAGFRELEGEHASAVLELELSSDLDLEAAHLSVTPQLHGIRYDNDSQSTTVDLSDIARILPPLFLLTSHHYRLQPLLLHL